MRKAKVAAIICGMIASCLFGGFAVVEASTITLDDSSADLVVYVQPATEDYEPVEAAIAVTVTSIEYNDTAEARTTTVNYAGVAAVKDYITSETAIAPASTAAVKTATLVEAPITTAAVQTTVIEAPLATTTEVRAPKESAAPHTTTTAAATTVTTTTTAAVPAAPAVNVEIIPITEEMTNPPMPAEQAAAPVIAEEQMIAVQPETEPAAAPGEVIVVPAVDEPVEIQQWEMPDLTMLEVPDVQPYEAPTDAPAVQPDSNSVSVSQSDYILLCNAVAHEAGSNSISAEEKAKVVEVIMNRVNSPKYPDSIYGVLTQKYQFTGSSTYVDLGSFSGKVTDLVKEAVDMYLADPTRFNHGYLSFYGDGSRNHFS